MTAVEFLDTNVLVYAYDLRDLRKQEIAKQLVRRALLGEILTSVQVLAEFAAAKLHKKNLQASVEDVLGMLDALGPIHTIAQDWGIARRAVEAHSEYGVHFYDGMIIASAERAGCSKIWSEDLNSGQTYFGVTVENPFA